jgi:hypothetical protein
VLPKPDYDSGPQFADSHPIAGNANPYAPNLVLKHNLGTFDVLVKVEYIQSRQLPEPRSTPTWGSQEWYLTANAITFTKRAWSTNPTTMLRVRIWKIST